MNDVIRLDELGVCAVGLCSNKATSQQVEMLVKFARQVAKSKITLLPDCDDEGKMGFKELLWDLSELKLDVRLRLGQNATPDNVDGIQPEEFTAEIWAEISE